MIGSHRRLPSTMTAVLLTRHGGFDALSYREDVLVPRPTAGQVLIEVAAAGVNNTDINTRVGWYSKAVRDGTARTDTGTMDSATGGADDGGWSGDALEFPRIQGADVCGRIVDVGPDVSTERLGERCIVATMQRAGAGGLPFATVTLGSEMDGGFAQYVATDSSETHAVRCDWTDVELASIPCASSTAENMLHRADVGVDDRLLITGASGGVGSAAVQLAVRRGADVTAVAGLAKHAAVLELGAGHAVDRDADVTAALGADAVDVVVDLVGGPDWPKLLDVLRGGGRYITSGAIAGPIVELDLRTLYLKDLTLLGATYQEPGVFENLVKYIERGEIRPLVHATYPLSEIERAQREFAAKDFVGKLVLVPPSPSAG